MSVEKKAADDISKMLEEVYSPKHEYAAADPKNFRWLDLRFYGRLKETLQKQGFRHLEDQEDLTLSRALKVRTLVRIMVSEDGTIGAGIYHYLPGFLIKLLTWSWWGFKVYEFESDLTDGTFIATTNAPSFAANITSPPEIQTEYLPKGTDPLVLLSRHRERLKSYLEANTSARPIIVRTVEDVREASHRADMIKAAFRKKMGGVTREELAKLSKYNSEEQLDEIHQEIQNKKSKQDQP